MKESPELYNVYDVNDDHYLMRDKSLEHIIAWINERTVPDRTDPITNELEQGISTYEEADAYMDQNGFELEISEKSKKIVSKLQRKKTIN